MKTFTVLFFLTISVSAMAQTLIPFRQGKLWGYSNPAGKIVIEPKYQRTYFFTGDNLARVLANGLYGFIDPAGSVKIKPQFTNAGDFIMGVASVETKNEKYCINVDGQRDECNPQEEDETVSNEPIEHFSIFNAGTKYRLILNASGDTLPGEFDSIRFISRYLFPQTNYFAIVYQNELMGAFNEQGVPVVPIEHKTIDILDMESYKAKEGGKWGVIKFDGSTILPFEYDSVNKVTELLFLGDRLTKNNHFIVGKDKKFGVVDHTNKVVLKTVYDRITMPLCSCPTEYVVEQNGLQGIMNHKGHVEVPLRYKKIEPFKGAEITSVVTATGQDGYIGKQGIEYFRE